VDCSDFRRARRGARELPADTDPLGFLLSLPPDAREEAVRIMGPAEADAFDRDWPTWAHDGQCPPPQSADGNLWSTCVVMGGRSFGKTRAGSEWIVSLVKGDGLSHCPRSEPLRIALVAATLAEARSVMIEGRSGLLEVAGPWIREWRPSLGTLKFRTGAIATLFSGHTPELLRGPQHDYAWCDELAKWEKAQETWDMLQLGLRLGDRPQALVTTTPRPGPVLSGIIAARGTVLIGGPSSANPHNSPVWLSDMEERHGNSRLGRQELGGELLPDTPGALWTVELLASCRAQERDCAAIANQRVEPASVGQPAPRSGDRTDVTDSLRDGLTATTFVRVVIGVDPPTADGTCGIIACAKDEAGRAHVLADHSVTARSPEGWARAVADAARVWGHLYTSVPVSSARGHSYTSVPVLVVAEQNQGGKMVAAVLRTAEPRLALKLVTAHVGKAERAAPVAMLFEAGQVVLHGRFPELEAELLGMIAGGEYEGPGHSPDRADAMVWGLTELMLTKEKAPPRIRAL
jgi:phage terminase large subunit-like protein